MAVTTVTYDSTTDSNALTITLAGLVTSATWIVGQQSTVVDNVTPLYVDFMVSGQITTGTTPDDTSEIRVYAFAPLKLVSSTYSYPIATSTQLGASDAAATFEANQVAQLRLAATAVVNATSDRAYAFEPFSIAQLFGGIVPRKWGLFVTHNTAVNLNATAGNHWFHWTGIKYTST